MQAESLVKHAPTGNYVLIAGSPNAEDAKVLHDAQMSVLRTYIDRGDIKVLADGYTKDWLASEAYLFMLKPIDSTQGKIPTIIALNDPLAGGGIHDSPHPKLAATVSDCRPNACLPTVIFSCQGTDKMT